MSFIRFIFRNAEYDNDTYTIIVSGRTAQTRGRMVYVTRLTKKRTYFQLVLVLLPHNSVMGISFCCSRRQRKEAAAVSASGAASANQTGLTTAGCVVLVF